MILRSRHIVPIILVVFRSRGEASVNQIQDLKG